MSQIIGVGAKLEYEEGSGWVEIQFVKSVNFPNFSVTSIDTTHLGLTDYHKTYMPGMIDGGSVSFTASYDAATYEALHGKLREVIGWRISDPDAEAPETITCDGFLVKLEVPFAPDEEVMMTGEIKMTGNPDVAGGA